MGRNFWTYSFVFGLVSFGSGGIAVAQGIGGGPSANGVNPTLSLPTTAPGTSSTQALGVQGVTGGLPFPTSQSGTWTVNIGTGQSIVLGAGNAIIGSISQNGTWTVGLSAGTSVSVSNLPATQAISAASLPLPTGAATAALQPGLNADGGAQVHIQNLVQVSVSAPDVTTVTTASTPVTAFAAGHVIKGGWIRNPLAATVNLCVAVNATAGTTETGSTSCLPPGSVYSIPPTAQAVSVNSTDASHTFAGQGYQ